MLCSKIPKSSSFSETTNTFAFLLGGTFIEERTFRIPRTASLIVPTAFSSWAKSHSAVNTGQEESMMVSSSSWRLQKISSVMKGMKGWRSFKAWISTVFKVQIAAALVVSVSS